MLRILLNFFLSFMLLGISCCEFQDQEPRYPLISLDDEFALELRDPLHHHGVYLNREWVNFKRDHSNDNLQLFFQSISTSDIPQVKYLEPAELKQYLVRFSDEVNLILNKPFFGAAKANLMYVMDEQGQFYVAPKISSYQYKMEFHHSSFFAGQPLAGCGFIYLDNNLAIEAIDNYSGHYKPDSKSMIHVLGALSFHGVELSKIKLTLFVGDDKSTAREYNANEWYIAQRKQP